MGGVDPVVINHILTGLGAAFLALTTAISVLWRTQRAQHRRCEEQHAQCIQDNNELWREITRLQHALGVRAVARSRSRFQSDL